MLIFCKHCRTAHELRPPRMEQLSPPFLDGETIDAYTRRTRGTPLCFSPYYDRDELWDLVLTSRYLTCRRCLEQTEIAPVELAKVITERFPPVGALESLIRAVWFAQTNGKARP